MLSCSKATTKQGNYEDYGNQEIEHRDSLLVTFTIKEWGLLNWRGWENYSKDYHLTNELVEYFIAGTFYSPDKTKVILWVGEKKPNSKSIKEYSESDDSNRICPEGADTVYSMTALIGIRNSPNSKWDLYPFDQQLAVCYSTKEQVINVLEQYYFKNMSNHSMYVMQQSGDGIGTRVLTPFAYNLLDSDFWENSWLWKKDTVGSYGLYPFQIKGYDCNINDYNRLLKYDPKTHKPYPNNERKPFKNSLKDCAKPFDLPILDYPKEIFELYNN
jgi:hypothetical protein